MCKKIREVNSLTPQIILERYWNKQIPVSIKQILTDIGVRFSEYNLKPLEESLKLRKSDAILGMAISVGDDLGILYSPGIDKNALNYVLAHEFAHCCLHMKPTEKFHVEMKLSDDLYSRSSNTSFLAGYKHSHKEVQADRFAADLLIPTDALLEFFCSNATQNVDSIARHFRVSKEIVRLKIMNLKRSKECDSK